MLSSYSTLRSNRRFEESKQFMPGGVSSPVRAFAEVDSRPVLIDRAEGPIVYDVDGNMYVDFMNGLGPLILGHSHPAVVEAIARQAQRGLVYAMPTEIEYELAELIVNTTRCLDQIRFVCSGTEAVMSALRVAKAATGRQRFIKFNGGYHGHSDILLARGNKRHMRGQSGGPPTNGDSQPVNNGLDPHIVENTIAVEYNDLDGVDEAFTAFPDEIAAVVIEPCATNMGLVPAQPHFLKGLREYCDRHGALLIFDEVVCGFRFRFGSISSDLGVDPDLVTFGKIIGGGTAIGAYGGRRKYMQVLLTAGGVFQGGTFAGNPLAMAAGLAQLGELKKPGFYERLDYLGAVAEHALRDGFRANNMSYGVQRIGSLLSLILIDNVERMYSLSDVRKQDALLFRQLHAKLMRRGILIPPSIEEPIFISAAHTENQVRELGHHLVDAIAEMRNNS